MRRILLFTLLITACAKAPPQSTTAISKSGVDVLSAFNETSVQKEEHLLHLASLALRAGITLGSARAEKCWREEASRPVLRENCLLLWAGGSEASPTLEDAVSSGRSRMLAMALLQRRALLGRVSYAGLLAILDTVSGDPLWLKAEITLAWLEIHGRPAMAEAEALLARIQPAEGAGPRDLASSLRAIRRLRAGTWQGIFGSYCDPSTRGEARLRCWRLLGALASNRGTLAEMRSFLPAPNDDDWILFSRTFPRLAKKIQAISR